MIGYDKGCVEINRFHTEKYSPYIDSRLMLLSVEIYKNFLIIRAVGKEYTLKVVAE